MAVRRPPSMIRVSVGIDPGFAAFGVAVIRRESGQPWQLAHALTVRTPATLDLHSRMHEVWHALVTLPKEPFRGVASREAVVSCENQSGVLEGKRRAGGTNASAALVQQVVGMVRVTAFEFGVKFVEPPPAQAKAVLGGIPRTASKAQVQRAVRALVRGCPARMSEHASDAIAVALAGARMVRC